MHPRTRFAFALALSAGLAACSSAPPVGPTLEGGATFAYSCGDGSVLSVRYYALSDGSLHFAKLRLPNGQELTLPQLPSGSGARYSDDTTTFWIKGNRATLEQAGNAQALECGTGTTAAPAH